MTVATQVRAFTRLYVSAPVPLEVQNLRLIDAYLLKRQKNNLNKA